MKKETKEKISSFIEKAKVIYDVSGDLAANIALSAMFDRRLSSKEKYLQSWESHFFLDRRDFPLLQQREDIHIKSNGNTLVMHYYKATNPKALILCVHGIHAFSDDHNAIFQNHFLEQGYSVLALDLTSSGESDGLTINGLEQGAYDVAKAIEYIQQRIDLAQYKLFLFGHSWGGYSVTAALNFTSYPSAVCEVAGFYRPDVVMLSVVQGKVGVISNITKEKFHEATKERSGKEAKLSALVAIKNNPDTNFLLVHGNKDNTIDLKRASIYHRVSGKNVKKVLCKGRGHTDLFYSKESVEHLKQSHEIADYMNQQYKKITNIPTEIMSYIDTLIQKEENSRLNEELFSQIDEFFEKNR